MKTQAKTSPPLLSVLLVSSAALAYEVLLIRLFSIVQWHHFAYMVISLALLGYGASGTFIFLTRSFLLRHYSAAYVANTVLFGSSSLVCFLLAQQLPFNTLEMFWDPGQWKFLLLSYLLLFVPFFFAANCICLAFAKFANQIPRIYAFDLIGAGLGAMGVIAALQLLSPLQTLQLVAVLGLVAGLVAVVEKAADISRMSSLALLGLIGITLLLPGNWLKLNPSQYKSLSQSLQIMGTRVTAEHHGPLGMLTVVESPEVPFRHAPGLSLSSSVEPPEQLAVYTDGDAPTVINRFSGDMETLAFLDFQTSALPYHLQKPSAVLLLGMGGGSGLLQAAFHESQAIHTVELNPQMVELFRQDYRDFSGWSFLADRTTVYLGDARAYFAANDAHFDLIQISLLDTAGAASGGVHGLSESYIYTREAITSYLQHLESDGMLVITRWLKLPPRDGLKLFATAIDALEVTGIRDPASHLMLIRSWSTSTLVVKKSRISEEEIARLQEFCEERYFDPAYFPGISEGQVNQYNILSRPYYYQGALNLLGSDREAFIERYKFNIHPATDDRPYFFNFFKWSTLPEIISLYRQGGFSLLELGYPVLLITLIQAIVVSVVLVLLPLGLIRDSGSQGNATYTWRAFSYFAAIGFAFLFIEIAFIQKFILFLAHPTYAVAVVLAGFLVFSGLGSFYVAGLGREQGNKHLIWIVLLLGLVAIGYLGLLPGLLSRLAGLSDPVRIVLSLLLIAPLAFCMGMPFPLGLSQVAASRPKLIPWIWAVNGCASLISAILATLLAIHFGFNWVVMSAVVLYGIAAWVRPWRLSTIAGKDQTTEA